VPNNHSKYRTPGVGVLPGSPVKLKRDHGGASVEPPGSLAGAALHHHAAGGEEGLHGPGRLGRGDSRQDHAPLRPLKPQAAMPA
jgi:hypothetical protein